MMYRALNFTCALGRTSGRSPTPQTIFWKPNALLTRNYTTPRLHHPLIKHQSSSPAPWRRIWHRARTVRHNSTKPTPPSPQQLAGHKPLSTSERLKELSRKYGWAALGVYLGLSALDFPFCFLAIRMLGPERVGEAEHYVITQFWHLVGKVVTVKPEQSGGSVTQGMSADQAADQENAEQTEVSVDSAASIWTQLLLAYGVHKSLIFFRVPIAAAITPNIVKYLRKRGWNIGRPKPAGA